MAMAKTASQNVSNLLFMQEFYFFFIKLLCYPLQDNLLQPKLPQFFSCAVVISMTHAVNTETLCSLHKHRSVFDISNLLRFYLCGIKGNAKNICVRFSETNCLAEICL